MNKNNVMSNPNEWDCFIDWYEANGGKYNPSLDLEWFYTNGKWTLDNTRVKATIEEKDGEYILNMTIDGHDVKSINHTSITYLMMEVFQIFENTDEYYVEDGIVYHRLDYMPYDRNGVHATGVEYLDTECIWYYEYEDDLPDKEE